MSLRVYDTLTAEKREFQPLIPGKVRMYACGVTPYDRSHIGHARSAIAYDIIYRYLKFTGLEVTFVRNFTDVDDKIIQRANERGVSAMDLADEFIKAYHEDMDALGLLRPDSEPRVSTTIPQIIALTERLVERGVAYASEGDVYFAVQKFEGYGKLGKRDLDDMMAGARVEVNTRKRHPMDFALWKAAKAGEPSWESPWGPGRPGWHIECSAMAMHAHGETIDLHGGGQDLIFPHHENEIAQSEGATGQPFAQYWVHNGFVKIDNEKMSKSLGNIFPIAEARRLYEPLIIRLFMISTHYHNPINYSDSGLDEAAARMAYFYESLRKARAFVDQQVQESAEPSSGLDYVADFEARFRETMDDDFNTPRAVALIGEAFKLLNEHLNARKAKQLQASVHGARAVLAALSRVDRVLGLFGENPETYLDRHRLMGAERRGLSLAWIGRRVGDRLVARAEKNWALADEIRDELLASGVLLMDGASGTDWMVQDTREARE